MGIIEAKDLYKNRTLEQVKAILKYEGDNSELQGIDRQHNEWWSIFELISQCRKFNMSELETYYVLSGRYKLERREH